MKSPIEVVRMLYPRGEEGGLLSVELTARIAAEGRVDQDIRAWTLNKLKQRSGGKPPRDDLSRARIIHDAIRQEKFYAPDPVEAELIPKANCTLTECGGITFDGGDCDDLTVALIAALESIGIRCAVVGHQYDSGVIEHVLAAVWDGGRYHYADPATDLPFGKARRPTRERIVDVPSIVVLCDESPQCPADIRPAFGTRKYGDFVGVGDAGQAQAQDVSVELAQAYEGLTVAWYEAARSYNTMQAYRRLSGKPRVDDVVYASISESWTPANERDMRTLATVSSISRQYTLDGAQGARPAGKTANVVWVLAPTTEPSVQEQNGNVLLVNSPGTGATEVVPAGFVGTGFGPAAAALGIAITIGAVIAVVAICDATKDHTARVRAKDRQDHQRALLEKGYTPDEVISLEESLAKQAEREATAETKRQEAGGLSKLSDTAKVAVYGALGLGLSYAVIQLVSAIRARRAYGALPAYG